MQKWFNFRHPLNILPNELLFNCVMIKFCTGFFVGICILFCTIYANAQVSFYSFAASSEWHVFDAEGRIVMGFSNQVFAGKNDIQLELGHLAGGSYRLSCRTGKGSTGVVRFIKQ